MLNPISDKSLEHNRKFFSTWFITDALVNEDDYIGDDVVDGDGFLYPINGYIRTLDKPGIYDADLVHFDSATYGNMLAIVSPSIALCVDSQVIKDEAFCKGYLFSDRALLLGGEVIKSC